MAVVSIEIYKTFLHKPRFMLFRLIFSLIFFLNTVEMKYFFFERECFHCRVVQGRTFVPEYNHSCYTSQALRIFALRFLELILWELKFLHTSLQELCPLACFLFLSVFPVCNLKVYLSLEVCFCQLLKCVYTNLYFGFPIQIGLLIFQFRITHFKRLNI
jgi:hypothetical protein